MVEFHIGCGEPAGRFRAMQLNRTQVKLSS